MGGHRLGFVAQTHTGALDYADQVAKGAEAGFDYVELYMDGATRRENVDVREVRSLHDRHDLDLVVHLPFVDLDLGSPRDRVREASCGELKACLDAAGAMGAEKAVLHADTDATPPEFERSAVVANALDSVRNLDGYAANEGVEICVENLPGKLFTVREFDELLDETEASLTLDTGHARVDGYDASEVADLLATHDDRISHVHVNDSRTAADEHVPVGSGTIDFETALAPVRRGEWTGTLSVEVYTFDFEYVATSRRKLAGWL